MAGCGLSPHFLISERPLDVQILKPLEVDYTILPAKPFILRPRALWAFYQGFHAGEQRTRAVIERLGVRVLIATGGFVSGPAIRAARKAGLAVAMVNLDAVPGKANRLMARQADEVFSAYPTAALPRAQHIGLPLRREALAGDVKPELARFELGLKPDMPTILVTAGSQGSRSINRMMMELTTRTEMRKVLAQWQVFHVCGPGGEESAFSGSAIAQAYAGAGIRAVVEPFCTRMGLAWAAADVAISRAGAGSVAEVWANAVPTIFFPYPFHRDEHQRFNCEPLVNAGAALMLRDRVDPLENVPQLIGPLRSLMSNDAQREAMRGHLRQTCPPDGATILAHWLVSRLGLPLESLMKK